MDEMMNLTALFKIYVLPDMNNFTNRNWIISIELTALTATLTADIEYCYGIINIVCTINIIYIIYYVQCICVIITFFIILIIIIILLYIYTLSEILFVL